MTSLTSSFRNTKVRDLAIALKVDKQIVSFQVSVPDTSVVQVDETVEHLSHEESNQVFFEWTVSSEAAHDGATWNIFKEAWAES